MKSISLILLVIALAGGVLFTPAADARSGWRRHGHGDRFHQHRIRSWHRGRWYHGHHAHRLGWWWIVDGGWYWYPAPLYPYPDPYVPPVIIQTPAAPPPLVVQPQPPAPVWYHCDQPEGYYPYVSACPGGWKTVPATPPASPAAPSSSPPGGQER